MKNVRNENLSNADRVLRMLVREIVKESIGVSKQGLDHASITKNPVKELNPVKIPLADVKLSIKPIIQELDESGLSMMVGGVDIKKESRPLVLFKLTSEIEISRIQITLVSNGVRVENLETTGTGVNYSNNLYNPDEIESLDLAISGFVKSGENENSLDVTITANTLVDPANLTGAPGYIVELVFDAEESTIKFTAGREMPRDSSKTGIYDNAELSSIVRSNPSSYGIFIGPRGQDIGGFGDHIPPDFKGDDPSKPKKPKFHDGHDYKSERGRAIVAALGGKVIGETNVDPSTTGTAGGGWGNSLTLLHNDKTRTHYAHLDQKLVSVGNDEILPGETIGFMGDTGRSVGVHLHFRTLDKSGNPIDPAIWYAEHPDAYFPVAVK